MVGSDPLSLLQRRWSTAAESGGEQPMRRSLQVLMFSLTFLTLGAYNHARAQVVTVPQASRVDIFGGYGYMRGNAVFTGERINLHGANFSAAYYVNNWLGIVADAGVHHAGNIANQFSLNLWSYQFGPRVRLRNDTRFTPYGQFLLGGGHAGGTIYTTSLGFGLNPIGTNNSFLFTVGGGLDYRLSNRFGIRVVQAEYLHSEFSNGSVVGHRQNNLRLSTGIVFSF